MHGNSSKNKMSMQANFSRILFFCFTLLSLLKSQEIKFLFADFMTVFVSPVITNPFLTGKLRHSGRSFRATGVSKSTYVNKIPRL